MRNLLFFVLLLVCSAKLIKIENNVVNNSPFGNSSKPFSYIVFTDPQYGLNDWAQGGNGMSSL